MAFVLWLHISVPQYCLGLLRTKTILMTIIKSEMLLLCVHGFFFVFFSS